MTVAPSPQIIINADDFGMSSEVNAGIVCAFQQGDISSTTIMANMPGFAEACVMARAHSLQDKIGVHLNITEGAPLTKPLVDCARFCVTGKMQKHTLGSLWYLSPTERRAIEAEFSAQVEAYMNQGFHPTHLDSHEHIHTGWPLGEIAIRIAHRFGIPAIRLARNSRSNVSRFNKIYKLAYNSRLRRAGLAKTCYFGDPIDILTVLNRANGPVEIMVHPKLGPDGRLVDHVNGHDLTSDLEHFRSHKPLVSYADLSRSNVDQAE